MATTSCQVIAIKYHGIVFARVDCIWKSIMDLSCKLTIDFSIVDAKILEIILGNYS